MSLSRVFVALWLVAACLACGQSESPASSAATSTAPAMQPASATPRPVRIGLVMKTLTNPFFIEMERGARRAEKELGIQLTVKTAAQETSIEQQILLIHDLTESKVDAIVIAPGDSQSLIPALKKASDAGVHIVNIDNRLDEASLQQSGLGAVAFVGVDNEAGAYQAARYLAGLAKKPSKAAILEGIRSADNARQRFVGAQRGLTENPLVKVVATETANWKIDEAYATTKRLFSQHPDLRLVFAANDMMALGASKFLQDTGRTHVQLAGFDALAEALAEIKSGHLVATVDQQAAEQGYQGISLALRLVQGHRVPLQTLINTRLITAQELR